MFLFQITNYDDPGLDAEVEELLRQRLEARSRQAMPGLWNVTDRLNARFDKGSEKPCARRCVFSILLLILGVFALIPGLMLRETPALVWSGGLAILLGFLELCLTRRKTPVKIPASCKKEAATLLEGRRAVDYSTGQLKVSFDETGMAVCSGMDQETVSYSKITGIFETERFWLLIYGEEKALLLQRKDLIAGKESEFSLYILRKISTNG